MHLAVDVGEVGELAMLCDVVRVAITGWSLFHFHVRELFLEIRHVRFSLGNLRDERRNHALSRDHVKVNAREKWMLLDLLDTQISAPDPKLRVIPQQFFEQVVGLWRKCILMALQDLLLSLENLSNLRRHLVLARRLLVLALERILAAEQLEEQDPKTEPVN